MKKIIISSLIAMSSISCLGVTAFARENTNNSENIVVDQSSQTRAKQLKEQIIPGGKGKIISNVWRGTSKKSGNTIQWDYQVSADYSGNSSVEYIMTEWTNSASLKTSASISGGASSDSISASSGSSWQTVTTPSKYWKNTNGSKNSSWRSTIVVNPKKDYRPGTVSTINKAKVKLKSDAKYYEAIASV